MPSRPATKPVSLSDIAKVAGVSRMTVSYALRNSPRLRAATRRKVAAVARRLGYVPDARLATLMSGVRAAKAKEAVPLAWLNLAPNNDAPRTHTRDAWRTHAWLFPYLEGARGRCAELGYKLDEIWFNEPGMSARRISGILYSRGIQGVILAPSPLLPIAHLRLDWTKFACVSFEKGIQAPRLHRALPDYFYNITLALKRLHRLGYRRIGLFLQQTWERRSHHAYLAGLTYFQSALPARERVPPLLCENEEMWIKGLAGLKKRLFAWIAREKPDVLVCQHSGVVGWLRERGWKVPGDIGVAHLAVEDDVVEWGGIWQCKREIGAAAAETAISLLQNHQLGLPAVARDLLIQGRWNPGKTVRASR